MTTQPTHNRLWSLPVIFLLSGIGLAYEIALTRLFSLMFQYHYVFLIVSIAVAGLGVGAGLAALMLRRTEIAAWDDLARATLLVALLIAGAVVVLSQLSSASLTLVALMAALLPFIGLGFVSASLFNNFATFSGVLYGADLLGAVAGLLLVLVAISGLGAFDTIAVLAILCALIAVWIGEHRVLRLGAAGIVVLLLIGVLLNQNAEWLVFAPDELKDAPPDKTMMTVLNSDPAAEIIETRWGPFARLDVVETSDDAIRYVFTDAGAGSTMVRYDGSDIDVAWLKQEVAYLPFTVNPDQTERALILGAGAGKDVLMAHLAGVDRIDAVEINPLMVDLTRDYADYNGGIFDLEGVQTEVMDARHFIERSDTRYDLIYANLVYSQAAVPGTSALAESYVFTQEALHAYWDHLTENGRIGFVTHHGIEGLRLLVAALDMLQAEGFGLPQALQHVSLALLNGDNAQTRTAVLMITRQPWSGETVNNYVTHVHARDAGLLYMPIYQETGMDVLISGAMTLDDYIEANADDYNYRPTTDNWPFFYQFLPGMPDQLADLLLIAGGIVFLYLSWAIFFFVRRDRRQWIRASLVPYFALLGAAFMLVEIPLIQRFNLLIGQPAAGLAAVIGALLVGGGLGSLLSSRFDLFRLPRLVTVIGLVIALVVALSPMLYSALVDWALQFNFAVRLAITTAALLPLGLLMGMPFPSGLRVAHQADPHGIAAFWGANAVTSVLGSAAAMALAIIFGFSAALWFGAGLYAVAALIAYLIWPRVLAA